MRNCAIIYLLIICSLHPFQQNYIYRYPSICSAVPPCAPVQLETDLKADPQDLDALKFVLHTIADTCAMRMDVELSYLDTMERYRTLKRYAIPVPAEEMSKANLVADRWQALLIEAKTKDLRLLKVKETFREVTKQQAVEFHEALRNMEAAFKASGPGNANTPLEDGVRLLSECQQQVQVNTITAVLGFMWFLSDGDRFPALHHMVDRTKDCAIHSPQG